MKIDEQNTNILQRQFVYLDKLVGGPHDSAGWLATLVLKSALLFLAPQTNWWHYIILDVTS